ncbi:hypothetical protein [Aquirhabdus parva]|uniref:Uncharacterized protein n=1 Tax=Aquirhabdus parva TaxID=2283318 RepID=A0A345P721_9GAMM|nr:hypothetical protein [Aquirhabdus parva]AXI03080.1 hypothetical protein HYN46_09650 [Aquirhabdus parva]
MLNRDQLQELGRFKLLMRKMHNQSVQIERFLTDFEYQSAMLDIAEEFDDTDLENDELIMLSLTLRSRFGRLGHGDEAYASIVPVLHHPASDHAHPTHQPAPEPTAASTASTNSVSLLRSIGNSVASAMSAKEPEPSQASTTTEPEIDKKRYVMSLR